MTRLPRGDSEQGTRHMGRNKSENKSKEHAALRAKYLESTPEPLDVFELPAPRWCDEEERQRFYELLQTVEDAGFATAGDRYSVCLLGELAIQLDRLNVILNNEGFVLTSESARGVTISRPHPLLAERNRVWGRLHKLLAAFGMLPASRQGPLGPKKIEEVEEKPAKEPWDELLS